MKAPPRNPQDVHNQSQAAGQAAVCNTVQFAVGLRRLKRLRCGVPIDWPTIGFTLRAETVGRRKRH